MLTSQSSNLGREKKLIKILPINFFLVEVIFTLVQNISALFLWFRYISPGFVSFRFVSQNRIRPSLPSNSESEHYTTILIRPWTCIHENNPKDWKNIKIYWFYTNLAAESISVLIQISANRQLLHLSNLTGQRGRIKPPK